MIGLPNLRIASDDRNTAYRTFRRQAENAIDPGLAIRRPSFSKTSHYKGLDPKNQKNLGTIPNSAPDQFDAKPPTKNADTLDESGGRIRRRDYPYGFG
jgi:hypothetical protein